MCNEEDYGLVDFKPIIDQRIFKIKIYQELCHEIFYVVQKYLDKMLSTMCTMYTKLSQL